MLTNRIRNIQNQYVAAFAASMTVMVSGASFVWPTPILPLLKESNPDALVPMTDTEISWTISLIEIGALISPIICGIISEKYGRKPGIALGGPFFIIGWILVLTVRDVRVLYLVRVFHGFGVSVVFTTCPTYLGEIAAVKIRGTLTAMLQTMWYSGILFQYFVGSYFSYDDSALINLAMCTGVFAFFCLTQQETPFYLYMKKKEERATKSLMLLRGDSKPSDDVASEMQEIKDSVDNDMKNKINWTDFSNISRTDIKILITVQLLATFRLFSGTIGIATYLSELLREAGWDSMSTETCMIFYGSVTLVAITIATFTVDRFGRRPLLLVSCIGTALVNAMLSIFYWMIEYSNVDLSNIRWLPFTMFSTFAVLIAIGLGPVTQTIQSELFPMNIRSLGNVVTAYNLTFTSFICLRSYQIFVDLLGVYANFLFYTINCVLAFVFIYIYVPETKGKTFLEINEYFSSKCDNNNRNDLIINHEEKV